MQKRLAWVEEKTLRFLTNAMTVARLFMLNVYLGKTLTWTLGKLYKTGYLFLSTRPKVGEWYGWGIIFFQTLPSPDHFAVDACAVVHSQYFSKGRTHILFFGLFPMTYVKKTSNELFFVYFPLIWSILIHLGYVVFLYFHCEMLLVYPDRIVSFNTFWQNIIFINKISILQKGFQHLCDLTHYPVQHSYFPSRFSGYKQ